jgi:hypothetical protein
MTESVTSPAALQGKDHISAQVLEHVSSPSRPGLLWSECDLLNRVFRTNIFKYVTRWPFPFSGEAKTKLYVAWNPSRCAKSKPKERLHRLHSLHSLHSAGTKSHIINTRILGLRGKCWNTEKKFALLRRIWGSHSGRYVQFYLLWYNVVSTDVSEEHVAFIFMVEEYAKQ